MTTIEKIENIDKLMEEYQVNDVYSLIEALQKGNQTKTEKLQKRIDKLEELITKLKIIPFIDSIDFDTVKTSEFDDVAYMRRRININFLLKY